MRRENGQSFTEFYLVYKRFTEFDQVLSSLTGCSWMLPGFTEFYGVVLSNTVFDQVLHSFTKIYRVTLGLTESLMCPTRVYWVLPSFIKFYQVLPSFLG